MCEQGLRTWWKRYISQRMIVLFVSVVYDTTTDTYITTKTVKYSSTNPYTSGQPLFEDVSFDPGNETERYVIQLHLFVSDVEGAQVRFNIGTVTVSLLIRIWSFFLQVTSSLPCPCSNLSPKSPIFLPVQKELIAVLWCCVNTALDRSKGQPSKANKGFHFINKP